jgi:hypothetical protein
MEKREIRSAINQLVEAWHDQAEAQEQLENFRVSHAPPKPPDQFGSLQDFLNFHDRKQSYEGELTNYENTLAVAKMLYTQTADKLRDALPENVPLHYTYEGGSRAASEGTEYRIVHRQGEVLITGVSGPARS